MPGLLALCRLVGDQWPRPDIRMPHCGLHVCGGQQLGDPEAVLSCTSPLNAIGLAARDHKLRTSRCTTVLRLGLHLSLTPQRCHNLYVLVLPRILTMGFS